MEKKKMRRKKHRNTAFVGITVFLGFIAGIMLFTIQVSQDAFEKEARESATVKKQENQLLSFYYSEKDKLQRYEDYQEKHPKMAAEEVVWRVNAGVDRKIYTEPEAAKETEGLHILVTKRWELSADFVPDDIISLPNGMKIGKSAGEAFLKLIKDAEAQDIYLFAQSGYRSYKKQTNLYEKYKSADPQKVDTYSAKPGFSEHQTGLAIDVNNVGSSDLYEFGSTKSAAWLSENAHKYGFIVRYTKENEEITGYSPEPWHIRYIGVNHATKMHENGIKSFEEYKVKYIDHTNHTKDTEN